MRSISWCGFVFGLSLVACSQPAGSEPVAAEEAAARSAAGAELRYDVVHLGSLGGTSSRGNVLDNRGWVAGYSQMPGNQVRRATLWSGDEAIDLGSLGGEHSQSNVPWAGLSHDGMVVGITQTGEADDLGQPWSCHGFFAPGTPTGQRCVGFVWDRGVMTELPALGGKNSFAAGVNSRGQVVGWAETAVHDPTCRDGQVRQFRAVLWEPRRNRVQELPPLPGDSASAATAINGAGVVVGISGECDQAVGRHTARHVVVWENGRPRRLPTLEGETWHTPMAINDRGDIAGFSLAAGGLRAVLWDRHGELTDLGTLGARPSSQANGINARSQVVGTSYTSLADQRAFLWQDGVMLDLTELAGPGYDGVLRDARHINDAGVITGEARDGTTGEVVTFVATPRRLPARP